MPIFGQVDPPSSDNTAGEFADGIKQQVETAGWPCGDYNDDDDDDDIYIMMHVCLSVMKNHHFLLGVSCNHLNHP